jgi:NTE family protein
VAGSSSGALVGGVYAAGKLREFREGFEKLTRGQFLRLLDPVVGRPGMIGGQRLVDAMREVVGDPRIEELALPFTAVAVDMERQRVVWLRSGPLWEALRASFAIPGLFPPQVVHGRELVDGGLLAPMPITATRLSDAHRLVAVDMHSRPRRPPGEPADGTPAAPVRGSRLGRWLDRRLGNPPGEASMIDTMSRALDTMQAQIARGQLALDPPELVINIPRDVCQVYEFWRAKELVGIGREAAEKALDAAGY